MVTYVKPTKMLVFVINVYLFNFAKGDKEHLSNYTYAKASCYNSGGLITQKLLTFSGLINITCELGVNNSVLKDGKSLWVQGQAQNGPYIALHTCMRFINHDQHRFARNKTFYSNILYECSVFCDKILHSTGYLGIYKDSCFCMFDLFRFPRTPECLEHDFMDIHKGIIVFRLMGNLQLNGKSKSANFNCLGASFQESGKTSFYETKCVSTLYSICTQRVDSDLSNKCLPKLEGFCFNEEKTTLLEHLRQCWLYNGTLIPFNLGITLYSNYSVMLGSFRAFNAIEDDGENKGTHSGSCLSITKYNETIYLETENCSNENVFICMDDIRNIFNTSGSEKMHLYLIICSILVSVGIILALLMVLVRYRRHFNNRPGNNNGTSQNDMYITPTADKRFENDAERVQESAAYDEVEEYEGYHEIVDVGSVRNTAP